MRGENSSSLIFIGFFLWWLPSIVCLTHPGRGWRTSKVKLACGRLVCRELSWLLTIVRRPSPLWVEAFLGGLFKKARGQWPRVGNSKPYAYTLQSSVCVWLPALTSPDDQLMTREMNWSLFYLCPGIFGPVVYQSKGHSVFSPSLLCWWKAHLFVSKAKHSSPVCFSVLWKPWLSFISNNPSYISCPFFLHVTKLTPAQDSRTTQLFPALLTTNRPFRPEAACLPLSSSHSLGLPWVLRTPSLLIVFPSCCLSWH